MKNILRFTSIFGIAACIPVHVNATHIVGGSIGYNYLGNDVYEIVLSVYRDCGPDNTNEIPFDDPAYIGIYNQDNDLIEILYLYLADATVTLLPYGIESPCLIVPPGVCIEEGVYTITTWLPPTEYGYEIVYVRCCRSPAIINLDSPQNLGMTCNTHVPGTLQAQGTNSSAHFTQLPPSLFCTNEPFSMNHSATDADGDSLSYALCQLLHGADPDDAQPLPFDTFNPIVVDWDNPWNEFYPIESNPAFAIDPVTGLFTGTATQTGKWVFGICVTEWRNGLPINTVRRDYMIRILNCAEVVSAIVPPVDACQGLTIQFENNSIDATSYHWDFGVENFSSDTSNIAEPQYTFPDTGYYNITLVADPGDLCQDSTNFTIAVFNPIAADAGLNGMWCDNTGLHVDVVASGDYSNQAIITWEMDGACTGELTVENPEPFLCEGGQTVEFIFSVEDHSCFAEVSFDVDLPPTPNADFNVVSEPCSGPVIEFENNSTGESSVIWNFGVSGTANDSSTENNPTFTYPSFGSFTVTLAVLDDEGCGDVTTQVVDVYDPGQLNLGYIVIEPLPCNGDSTFYLQFTGGGATSVEWLVNGETFTDTLVAYFFNEPGESFPVEVTAVNAVCDQEESDAFVLDFPEDLPVFNILVPNIITPNKDSNNQLLRPFDKMEEFILPPGKILLDYLHEYSLKVYDRWGSLRFDTTTNQGWDGRVNDRDADEGVYYYILNYKLPCSDEPVNKTGYVHVVR